MSEPTFYIYCKKCYTRLWKRCRVNGWLVCTDCGHEHY